jgi:hypothetical protein
MNKSSINLELNNHTKDLIDWKAKFGGKYPDLGITFNEENWYKNWNNNKIYYLHIGGTSTLYTTYAIRIELNVDDDKVRIVLAVTSSIRCWKKLEQTGFTRVYNDFKFEYLEEAFKYILEARHIVWQQEEYVQKSIGLAVRKCEAIKDMF